MRPGFCVWLTGLPCSGKTTIARRLVDQFSMSRRRRPVWLDGDDVRAHVYPDLGFTKKDRDQNVRAIGFMAHLVVEAGGIAVVSVVSPYEEGRAIAKCVVGETRFIEVFVNCSLDTCIERDRKAMYAMAKAGEIKNFTGVNDPYEKPKDPDVEVITDSMPVEQSLGVIIKHLKMVSLLEDM